MVIPNQGAKTRTYLYSTLATFSLTNPGIRVIAMSSDLASKASPLETSTPSLITLLNLDPQLVALLTDH